MALTAGDPRGETLGDGCRGGMPREDRSNGFIEDGSETGSGWREPSAGGSELHGLRGGEER